MYITAKRCLALQSTRRRFMAMHIREYLKNNTYKSNKEA